MIATYRQLHEVVFFTDCSVLLYLSNFFVLLTGFCEQEEDVTSLKQELEDKSKALEEAEVNIIRLSKQYAELITKELYSAGQ